MNPPVVHPLAMTAAQVGAMSFLALFVIHLLLTVIAGFRRKRFDVPLSYYMLAIVSLILSATKRFSQEVQFRALQIMAGLLIVSAIAVVYRAMRRKEISSDDLMIAAVACFTLIIFVTNIPAFAWSLAIAAITVQATAVFLAIREIFSSTASAQ